MPKFAANLTMLFAEVPFPERFQAAARAGFRSVEFLFPYEYKPDEIRRLLEQNHQQAVLFNLPSGNWAAGDRGLAANPARVDEFRSGVSLAVKWAKALGVPRLNCLAGKAEPGYSQQEHWQTLVDSVRFAADALREAGLTLNVEPINHYDVPGFVLNTTRQAAALLAEAGRPNTAIQYDIYHAQRQEGNLTPTLREHLPLISHIQIADNPGRNQPGTGEINYPFLFAELDRLGYSGYVSLEYMPAPDTVGSLVWIREYGYEPA